MECNVISIADAHSEDKMCLKAELKRLEELKAAYNTMIGMYDDSLKNKQGAVLDAKKTFEIFEKSSDFLSKK